MPTESETLNSTWKSLGAGPMYIENAGPNTTHLHFGSTLPSADTDEFINLAAGASRDYGGSDTVYGRSTGTANVVTVT